MSGIRGITVSVQDASSTAFFIQAITVLRFIVRGRTNHEIAVDLYVSETTVKTHINYIFAKLGAYDRAQQLCWHTTSVSFRRDVSDGA